MNEKRNDDELDALIDSCLDGRLSTEEAEKLSHRIEESSEARQRYWEMASVHGMIEQSMQNASLKAVTGEAFSTPMAKLKRPFTWPRLTEIAAGIAFGILSASLVWAYKTPPFEHSPRETTELLFESFEDPSVRYFGRFPKQAGVWHGDMASVKPKDGILALRGDYVAKMTPVSERKFSYVRRILDLSTLPLVEEGKNREIQVQTSFLSLNTDHPSHYQIRLAVFREHPEDLRPIWNDESVLFDRVLQHVGKNHITESPDGDWRKVRASIEIPPDARCVLVSLAVADVARDAADSEHYLDAIRFRLIETLTYGE
ncbi:MAG: hypothetical protein ISQ73_07970 [Verrucomicrobiae bacterium]|nr:hypothetical protein [Verrucomicrobiae bacterium]